MTVLKFQNNDRKHIWQCQLLTDGKWVDQLGKPYPRKSALREKEWLYDLGYPLEDIRIVNVNSETYRGA